MFLFTLILRSTSDFHCNFQCGVKRCLLNIVFRFAAEIRSFPRIVVQQIARKEKRIQFKSVIIANRLQSRRFHFNGNATFAFSSSCFVLRFHIHGVSRPRPSDNVRQIVFLKDFCNFVAVFYFDIIGRRHIVIRKPFVAIGMRGDYQFSATFFLIQNAARTVYDKLGT